MSEVVIPDDVFDSIRFPDGEKEQELQVELAVSLYRRGALSFGKARQLAGLSKQDFHRVLGERNVERHYGEKELEEDLKYSLVL
jgi:predicted HTH domain antitoxin